MIKWAGIKCLNCDNEAKSKHLCKTCYEKQYYLLNREKCIKQSKKYAQKNKEARKKYQKQYCKAYYQQNKEHLKNVALKWYKDNIERHKQYNKQYRKDHPEIIFNAMKKHLMKYGKVLNKNYIEYGYALNSWSKTVRKNKTCEICGEINDLHAHHILYKQYYPQLSLNINNGITLCKTHHNEVHGKLLTA